MRLAVLALLAALPAFGVWDASDTVNCEIGDGYFWCEVISDGALGDTVFEYAKTSTTSSGNKTPTFARGSSTTAWWSQTGFKTGETWYMRIEAASQGAFDCTNITLTGAGVTCELGAIKFTMGTVSSSPAVPAFTRDLDTHRENLCWDATPTQTWTVDDTGSGCKTNFKTAWDAAVAQWNASAANRDNVYEIPIECDYPLGDASEDVGEGDDWSSMTVDAGALGGIRIRSAGDAKLFYPKNVRVDPSLSDSMIWFGREPTARLFGDAWDRFQASGPFDYRSDPNHVCMVNVETGYPAPGVVHHVIPITGASGNNTLTVGSALPDGWHQGMSFIVQCDSDTGGWSGLQRCAASHVPNGDCNGGDTTLILNQSMDDNSCTGGQIVAAPTGTQVSGVSTGGVLTTVQDMPMLDFPELPIDSVTDLGSTGRIVLNAAMPTPGGVRALTVGDVTTFTGTGTALDGAPVEITAIASDTQFDVALDPAGACATDCAGTVRRMEPFVLDFTGDSNKDGVWYGDKLTDTTIQLLDPSDFSNQTFAAASTKGWVAYEPEKATFLGFNMGDDKDYNYFDGVLFHEASFPLQASGASLVAGITGEVSERFGVWHSYYTPKENWGFLDPVRNAWANYATTIASNYSGELVTLNNLTGGFAFVNNAVTGAHGIVIGTSDGTTVLSHMTAAEVADCYGLDISRNDYRWPDRWRQPKIGGDWSNSAWTGRSHSTRHFFETKGCGGQVRFVGNKLHGNPIDGAGSVGSSIILKGIASDTAAAMPAGDHLIKGNIAWRVGELFTWSAFTQGRRAAPGPLEISYNLVFNDAWTGHLGRNQVGNEFTGTALMKLRDTPESVWMHHNTVALSVPRNALGHMLSFEIPGGRRVVEKNILYDADGVNKSLVGFVSSWASTPSCDSETVNTDAMFKCFAANPDGDGTSTFDSTNSAFDDNVLLGGLEDASQDIPDVNTDMALSSDATQRTSAEVSSRWGTLHTTTANLVPTKTAGVDSLNDLLDDVYTNGEWDPTGTYDGYGAEPSEIAKWAGLWRMTSVSFTASSVTFNFTVPVSYKDGTTKEQCFVDISTDKTFDTAVNIIRQSDSGQDGTETFTGLTTGTYWARYGCSNAGPVRYTKRFYVLG